MHFATSWLTILLFSLSLPALLMLLLAFETFTRSTMLWIFKFLALLAWLVLCGWVMTKGFNPL